MSSKFSRKLSRALLLALLAATALLIAHSSRLIRSSLAEQAASEPPTRTNETPSKAEIADHYGKLPLNFEVNKGQTDRQVRFLSRGPGYHLFLTSVGLVLTLQEPALRVDKFKAPESAGDRPSTSTHQVSVLRLTMIGANPEARVAGQDELPGKINYLVGNDRDKWLTNIPTYLKVHYAEIYPRVDLVYYGNRTELEYDFVVAPGGDPQKIKFQIEGTDRLKLDQAGNLLLHINKREVKLSKPIIYQLTDKGDRREVKGDYLVKGSEIGFKVKSFDSSRPLIIDPVLSYSTLLGSGNNEYAYGIAVDSLGNSYVTGYTDSVIFPTTPGAFQTTGTVYGAFVSKLDATGTNLVYSTYLSGSSGATGTAIAVDLSGNAYITGSTTSSDFPSVNAIRGSYNFVRSVDSGASWTGKSLSPPRTINSLAIDPQTPSTIYAGTTGGAGVYKSIDNGNSWSALSTGLSSAFVPALAIDPNAPSTIYAATNSPSFGVIKSTNGGTSWTAVNNGLSGAGGIYSLAIDPVSPSTLYLGSNGGLFKTTNGGNNWTSSNNGLGTTAFTIAIDPTTPSTLYAGGGVVFKSTNGGANWSQSSTGLSGYIHSLVIDPTNTAIIYAGTSSGSSAVFKSINGGGNWTSASSGLGNVSIYSFAISPDNSTTVYAGSGNGKIFKTLDGGNSWNSSYTTIASLTVLTLVIDPSASSKIYAGTYAGVNAYDSEVFLAKLNDTGSALVYSTFLGGSGADYGYGIAIDSAGNAYVTGQTASSDFLTASPFQATSGGNSDAFVAKINPSGSTLLYSTYLGGGGFDTGSAIATDSSGNAYVTGNTGSTNFPIANAFQATKVGGTFTSDAFATKLNSNGTLAYSTYLGGNDYDNGYGIAVDSSGNAYITGQTTSSNFPTLNPIQPTNGGSVGDAFVTKLNNLGSGLVYSTYLGGSNIDSGRGIAVDSAGSAHVTGFTASAGFPLMSGALRTKSPFYKSRDGANNWSNDNYGLKVSGINVIEIDPTNPAIVYAGTSIGVFKSVDAGNNWTSINNGLNQADVRALIIDPSTSSTLYVGMYNNGFGGASGVYKSTNGGNSWSAMNTGLTGTYVLSLALSPSNPSTLYAGTYGFGIFKSTNGGASWSQVLPSGNFASAIAVDPLNPNVVYAGEIFSGSVLIKSLDAGNTWNPTSLSGDISYIRIAPTNTSILYASGLSGAYRSTNSGGNWTQIKQGFAGNIAIDPVTPTTIYLLVNTGSGPFGVLKSTDSGNTFTTRNQGINYLGASAIAINPSTASTLYLGSGSGNDDDAFVSKINPSGSALIYSTLLGGSLADFSSSNNNDEGNAIALDSVGNAYVAGQSRSLDFPVSSDAYQPFNRGFTDIFVSKLTMSYIINGLVLDGNNAPVSGAEVTLSDGASLSSIITESDGSYQFSHLREGGNFTVSAAKPHFTMAPTSQTFNNLNSNQTLNFIATATNAPFYSISGQVTDNGAALGGVIMTLSGSQPGTRTTDGNGNYSFALAESGNYTLTPSLLGFNFSPSSQTFNNLSSNQTANFAATRQNLVVTNANDHGTGSLRQAILDANTVSGLDTIVFNIPGSGVKTINLQIALPVITDPVVIDAATQPGYAGTPLIELNGTAVGTNNAAFWITAGGSTIRGFVINRFSNAGFGAIYLRTNGSNIIQGNYIGLDSTGTLRSSNYIGIQISNSSYNLIGGTTLAARNVISGNSEGISVSGSDNQIMGNFIGTNAAGTAAVGNASGNSHGIVVNASFPSTANNVIGGTTPGAGNLISGNQRGISLNSSDVSVQGNRIGTDVTGTLAVGNGVGIEAYGANTLIGGTAPGARNVISGNAIGVNIFGQQGKVQGNFIGTDITGTLALGNTFGGVIAGYQSLIGGNTPEARNIISANGGNGNVVLGFNGTGDGATVQGNYIGTDLTGNVALVNPSVGISISGSNNLIGGLVPGARNIISGNTIGIQTGVLTTATVTSNVVQGNFIGLNAAGNASLPNQFDGVSFGGSSNNNTIGGTENNAGNIIAFNGSKGVSVSSGLGNSIRGNSIFSNSGLGIDLSPNGVTANDVGDADPGANNLQNFPLLTSVISNGGSTTIQGTLNSTPNTIFQIDFYSNAACDPSGNGEGASFFDTTSVTTDANGNATINLASSVSLASGRVITATATDPSGNTSEFSPCDSTNAIGSVQFSSASYNVLEDIGNAVITVIRSGGSKGALSVNYSTADGTATAGSDYTAVSGTLVFGDGEVSKTISIPIADDGVTEPAETLRVNLSATDLDTIGSQGAATLTIQDSSTPLILTMNSIDVLEGDSGSTNAVVTVNLSAATGRTVTADFNTIGGSATSGEDFTAVTGSLTFAPGVITQQIMIPIIGDTLQETNETFQVVLSNPTNASVGNSSLVRIVNDPPNAVDDTLSTVAEDSSMRTIPIASLLSNDTNGQANGSPAGLAFSLIAASEFGGTVSSDATNVYFTPAGNFNGQASFRYRLSESGAANPENDTATVRFTITEVVDTPSVTNATTYVNTQTTSGLVISRNIADSGAITHFKITNILNGVLFKNNGSTPINANDFITSFEGNAGLKFTPATGLTSPGSTFSFDVQASTSNSDAGLGVGVATATITVNPPLMFIVNTLADVSDPALNGVCDTDAGMAGEQCTLRAAIQETNNSPGPDIIGFDPALNGTTITLNNALDAINSNLAINGPAANLLTVRRSDVAATSFRIFTINAGKTVSITGLTVSNGRTVDATISNESGNGGGILNEGTLNLDGVVVSDNSAGDGFSSLNGGFGGGIYSTGSLTVTNSSVVGNKAGKGSFHGSNGGSGGGIYSSGPVTLTDSLVNGNQTGAGSDITHATGGGGGLYCSGILILTNSTVSDNQTPGGASAGGGAGIAAGTLTLTNSRVINNTAASGNGGGISSGGSTTTLTNSVVSGNHANLGSGGGISSSGALKVVSSAITDNTSFYGGGLNIQGSNPASVVNSTISGNSSAGFGGGLYYAGSIAMTNVTVTNNRCDSDTSGNEQGGGIYRSFGSLTLNNTIVARNFRGSSPGSTADDISGTAEASSSFNLIGTGGSGGLTNGINNNQVGVVDARLGPLANNGGPSQTHALLAGSPALDAGNNAFVTNPPFTGPPFTDQRVSFSRIADGDGNGTVIVDVGAYERQGILIDTVNPRAGRTSGGQQIQLVGAFANLSTVTIGGASATWFYTNGSLDTSVITVTTPAHAVGAVQIDLTPTSGSPYSKPNAFAYLPTVFTDNTIMVGQTTAKGQHIIELRQAVDALRAVAGLSPAPWTDATLTPSSSIIKAVHILELRIYLDDAAGRLGFTTAPYTDPSLTSGFTVKRIHMEELRQRIRTIAG